MREKLLKNSSELTISSYSGLKRYYPCPVELPRVSVFRSNRYFYAQAIDDTNGTTLASVDGRALALKANREDVAKLAKVFSETLKSKDIQKIAFDRNGYLYHGVVASFAQSLRDNGIAL